MNDFYELDKECHDNRIQEKCLQNLVTPQHLIKIKSDFICYYRMNEKPFDAETFEQFLINENVKVNSIEEKWLMNRIFG